MLAYSAMVAIVTPLPKVSNVTFWGIVCRLLLATVSYPLSRDRFASPALDGHLPAAGTHKTWPTAPKP